MRSHAISGHVDVSGRVGTAPGTRAACSDSVEQSFPLDNSARHSHFRRSVAVVSDLIPE